MIKIEETEIFGWEAAIRGTRNPLNSWAKSDSGVCYKEVACHTCQNDRNHCKTNMENDAFVIGYNDLNLMKRLRNAGTDHRKFMRMITVYVDITAPLYWWKEADTYRIGVEKNSCSTMHKLTHKEFELSDFSTEHMNKYSLNIMEVYVIQQLNYCRNLYLAEKDPERKKDAWWQMIQLLPSSYNQKRTVMLNYEVLANIYKSRKGHKLDEWHDICDWIEGLPYSKLISGKEQVFEYADQPGLANAAQPIFQLGC